MITLKKIARAFIDGLPVAAFALVLGAAMAKFMSAQTASQSQPSSPFSDLVPGSHSPWFFVFIGWYVFSAMVSGMPEPTADSSPWYIWAYRSFHILSASGTSFFQNKIYWPVGGQANVVSAVSVVSTATAPVAPATKVTIPH